MADRLLVSTRKGLFCLGRSGRGRWQVERVCFLGDNVTLTLPDPRDGLWYAALDHGHFGAKLHRSPDRGATWEEVGVPAYPEPPAGYEEKDAMGRVIPWKLQRFWALEPGLADQEGLLWAGTIPGGLFRSPDRGATWDLVRGLWEHPDRREWLGGGADFPGIHSICVDPRDARRVTRGRVLRGRLALRGRGRGLGLPRARACAPPTCRRAGLRTPHPGRAPDGAVPGPAGGVLGPAPQRHVRSADAGRLAGPGGDPRSAGAVVRFPVAVHPADPPPPGSCPATRTSGGSPWTARWWCCAPGTAGAASRPCAGACPRARPTTWCSATPWTWTDGERLAFGSTTGSLWVTEDGGDDWTTVANTCRRCTRCAGPDDPSKGVRPVLRFRPGANIAVGIRPQRLPSRWPGPNWCRQRGKRRPRTPWTGKSSAC